MFTPLNEREIEEIVGIQVSGIRKMLAKNGVQLGGDSRSVVIPCQGGL